MSLLSSFNLIDSQLVLILLYDSVVHLVINRIARLLEVTAQEQQLDYGCVFFYYVRPL